VVDNGFAEPGKVKFYSIWVRLFLRLDNIWPERKGKEKGAVRLNHYFLKSRAGWLFRFEPVPSFEQNPKTALATMNAFIYNGG